VSASMTSVLLPDKCFNSGINTMLEYCVSIT
jgi:hypothetical protein